MKLTAPLLTPLLVAVVATASSLRPPVLPLAVRNPYMSLWYHARLKPWETWPQFWTGAQLGVGIMAQTPHDGKVYSLLGRPQDSLDNRENYTYTDAVFNGFQYDSSTTSLKYTLGNNVKVELLWSSPVTGESTMRQSIPASYLEIKVSGNQTVNVYMDVNGMWVTGDRSAKVVWDYTYKDGLQSWIVQKQTQMLFTEKDDRGEWGNFYFTAPKDRSITYQEAESSPMRRQFAATGVLTNTLEKEWRTVLNREPAFAYVKNFLLSDNGTLDDSVLYTLALAQDPVVQFASATGYRWMDPLWKSYWRNDAEMLAFHYHDYANASEQAAKFSKRVTSEATKLVSETYADIAALAARQVMGATYFSGTINDPILFLKEISSNGNFQTVDVIFPAYPFFLYLNPDWLAYLLEPLLEHQMAGLYPNLYSMHDLGSSFPNATGHPDGSDEPMPVEESGNMLIMALSYIQTLTPEHALEWINREGRYHLWTQWTQFLVEEGLIPENQLSTDDFAGRLANQTNLAVKALVGIRAMSQIASAVGNINNAKNYLKISDDYLPQWEVFSMAHDGSHTKLAYHWYGSHGTLYNLYADAALCFHLPINGTSKTPGPYFSPALYRTQSSWYQAVTQRYGLPLDSRHIWAKTDWQMWAAAIAGPIAQHGMVEQMGAWINETPTDRALTDLFDTNTGGWPKYSFMARPVVGGHYAALTLNNACSGRGMNGLHAFWEDKNASRSKAVVNVERSLEEDRIWGRNLGELEPPLQWGANGIEDQEIFPWSPQN